MFNVTDTRVRDAYLYLRTLPPFTRWNMPPASECVFGLLRKASHHAEYVKDGKHLILVNPDQHITLVDTLMSVAHEMVRLRQEMLGRLSQKKDPHNAEFRRLAKQVCSHAGFDLQKF